MLPRERVKMALNHVAPDRVPTDFWAVPELWERLMEYLNVSTREEVMQHFEVDIRTIAPDYIGPGYKTLPDGTFYHEDGTHRRWVKNSVSQYQEYASYPLADCETVDEIVSYAHWPKVEDYDWAGFSDKIGDLHERYYIKVELGGLFELSWGLRGIEQMMIDMYEYPEIFHALMAQRTKFYIDFVHKAMEVAGDKIDAFYTYDDIAIQNSLLLNKNQWREFIRPYHVEMNAVIKQYGKDIVYHSCGAVVPMIDELAELPIDVLNPLQPAAAGIDMQMIKDTWGDRLCFHGAVCIQRLLPHGTPEEVYDTVSKTIKILGKNGGYIMTSAHFMQNDTPNENVLAMYRAAKETVVE